VVNRGGSTNRRVRSYIASLVGLLITPTVAPLCEPYSEASDERGGGNGSLAKPSYLTPLFDPDVFVSYSHGDPIEGRAPLRDWTQALIQRLQDRLHALETEFDDLRLWMDPLVDPTADLTEELREKASASGVLMIVMSNRYLKSSWCKKEADWFREQFDQRTGERGRVFVLHAQKA
jgi:TIR domain-containing protein